MACKANLSIVTLAVDKTTGHQRFYQEPFVANFYDAGTYNARYVHDMFISFSPSHEAWNEARTLHLDAIPAGGRLLRASFRLHTKDVSVIALFDGHDLDESDVYLSMRDHLVRQLESGTDQLERENEDLTKRIDRDIAERERIRHLSRRPLVDEWVYAVRETLEHGRTLCRKGINPGWHDEDAHGALDPALLDRAIAWLDGLFDGSSQQTALDENDPLVAFLAREPFDLDVFDHAPHA